MPQNDTNFNTNVNTDSNPNPNPNSNLNLKQTTMLCILDGFGLSPAGPNNTVALSKMPNLRKMLSEYVWLTLNSDGESVGQETGIVGNSEVGHINIGGLGLIPQLSWEITGSAKNQYAMPAKLGNPTNQLFSPTDFYKAIWEEKTEADEVISDFPTEFESPADGYIGKGFTEFGFETTGTSHLIGLFSTGQIHSDMRHLAAAIACLNDSGAKKIVLHLLSDGRDSDRRSLFETWQKFESINQELLTKVGNKMVLGSLGGRFYGMDRDNNLDRVATGIRAMLDPLLATNTPDFSIFDEYFHQTYGAKYWNKEANYTQEQLDQIASLPSIGEQIQAIANLNYNQEIFDETIYPFAISGNGIGLNDDIWLFNFRIDRMREMTEVLICLNQTFNAGWSILSNNDYNLTSIPKKEVYLSYDGNNELDFSSIEHHKNCYYPIFRPMAVKGTLAEVIAQNGQIQLHIAETEKYNHVTYFINGAKGENEGGKQDGEGWILVPSNKVDSHSQMPAMKAVEITDYIIENGFGKFDYIICNYANPDMLGHTGDLQASIESMEILDAQLGRLLQECLTMGHKMLITADHGNVEFVGHYEMAGKELTDTEHNPNLVPCILVSNQTKINNLVYNLDKQKFTSAVLENARVVKGGIDIGKIEDAVKNCLVANPAVAETLSRENNWLSKEQIVDSKLPLWYAGLLFLAIGRL